MIEKNIKHFEWLAEEFDVITVEVFQNKLISHEDMILALDNLQRRVLDMIDKDEESNLIVLRRIAERKFSLTEQISDSFDLIQKLFNELTALGFESLQRRCTFEIIFSLSCIRHNQSLIAKKRLSSLLQVVNSARNEKEIFYLEVEKKRIKKILENI